MLSHRYGSRFLLEEIVQEEFEIIKHKLENKFFKLAGKSDMVVKMSTLLDCFYECDLNDMKKKMYKIKTNNQISFTLRKDLMLHVSIFAFKGVFSSYSALKLILGSC